MAHKNRITFRGHQRTRGPQEYFSHCFFLPSAIIHVKYTKLSARETIFVTRSRGYGLLKPNASYGPQALVVTLGIEELNIPAAG